MDKKIIPVEFKELVDGAYVLNSPDGRQYKLMGEKFPTKVGSLIHLDNDTYLRLTNEIILENEIEEIHILHDEDDDSDIKQCKNVNLSKIKEKERGIWREESTRILVEMYKELKPLVGKTKIRTMKQMWEKINDSLKQNGYNYDIQQVESKWKSLVRSHRVGYQHGLKRRSTFLGEPFERELGEILYKTKCKINSSQEDIDSTGVTPGPSENKNFRLQSDEILSNGTNFNSNIEGINYNLCRIVKAIEVETSNREKAEEIKLKQRERLIKAIEKGNELLSKLLQHK